MALTKSASIAESDSRVESKEDLEDMDDKTRIVASDPSGRFLRYNESIGVGAYKEVFKGFDQETGVEVAWNQLKISNLSKKELAKIVSEIQILRSLENEHIINCFHYWVGKTKEGQDEVCFITELMTSGTLKGYIRKAKSNIKKKVLKSWCRQILLGLTYLHTHDPPIIHRDLKCENIFINGNLGEVKIGDLGLATFKLREHASSVLGTPEFMAPELYDEKYNEKVDIYAFGMCVLEMVTKEYPYGECNNAAQIYKRVTQGIMPEALRKVDDPETRDFIELCLLRNTETRPSASQLLAHPFLEEDGNGSGDDRASASAYDSEDTAAAAAASAAATTLIHPSYAAVAAGRHHGNGSSHYFPSSHHVSPDASTLPHGSTPTLVTSGSMEYRQAASTRIELVESSEESLLLKLTIAFPDERTNQEIRFPFVLTRDSPTGIAEEMVRESVIAESLKMAVIEQIDHLIDTVHKVVSSKTAASHSNTTEDPTGSSVIASGEVDDVIPDTVDGVDGVIPTGGPHLPSDKKKQRSNNTATTVVPHSVSLHMPRQDPAALLLSAGTPVGRSTSGHTASSASRSPSPAVRKERAVATQPLSETRKAVSPSESEGGYDDDIEEDSEGREGREENEERETALQESPEEHEEDQLQLLQQHVEREEGQGAGSDGGEDSERLQPAQPTQRRPHPWQEMTRQLFFWDVMRDEEEQDDEMRQLLERQRQELDKLKRRMYLERETVRKTRVRRIELLTMEKSKSGRLTATSAAAYFGPTSKYAHVHPSLQPLAVTQGVSPKHPPHVHPSKTIVTTTASIHPSSSSTGMKKDMASGGIAMMAAVKKHHHHKDTGGISEMAPSSMMMIDLAEFDPCRPATHLLPHYRQQHRASIACMEHHHLLIQQQQQQQYHSTSKAAEAQKMLAEFENKAIQEFEHHAQQPHSHHHHHHHHHSMQQQQQNAAAAVATQPPSSTLHSLRSEQMAATLGGGSPPNGAVAMATSNASPPATGETERAQRLHAFPHTSAVNLSSAPLTPPSHPVHAAAPPAAAEGPLIPDLSPFKDPHQLASEGFRGKTISAYDLRELERKDYHHPHPNAARLDSSSGQGSGVDLLQSSPAPLHNGTGHKTPEMLRRSSILPNGTAAHSSVPLEERLKSSLVQH